MLVGCDLFQVAEITEQTLVGVQDVLSDAATGRNVALAESGFVTVEVVNSSTRVADARVTMRIAGAEVHLAARRVPAKDFAIIVGPDRCDTIVVEATFGGDPPFTLPPQLFELGRDFDRGSTVRVLLQFPEPPVVEPPAQTPTDPVTPPPPPPPPPPAPPTEPPPPPAATIALELANAGLRINPGTPVTYDVLTTNVPSGALVFAFADIDAIAGNGNESLILSGAVAAARTTHTWETAATPPGLYSIYAELRSTDGAKVSAGHVGSIRLNAAPSLVLSSPRDEQLFMRSTPIPVAWVGADGDDDAKISIFIDSNDDVSDGILGEIRGGISEDNVSDRALTFNAGGSKFGEFYVGATISDGLSSATVYAGRVCLTDGLVGRLSVLALATGRVTEITGVAPDPNVPLDPNDPNAPSNMTPRNVALGATVDIGGDFDGDGLQDLLVGDPKAQRTWDGAIHRHGSVYLHTVNKGLWPRLLSVRDMRLRIDGVEHRDHFGAALTSHYFLDPGNFSRDGIVVGAPNRVLSEEEVGAAYSIGVGEQLEDPNRAIKVEHIPSHLWGKVIGDLEYAGHAVASVELSDDSMPDLAIGAAQFSGSTGRVAIFYGEYSNYFSGHMADAAIETTGWLLIGNQAGDFAGHSIANGHRINVDGRSDLIIGAPGAFEGAGKVYVFLPTSTPHGQAHMESAADYILTGENPGDAAGFSVSSVDFDGDGAFEILIGAPTYGASRGRVYWVKSLEGAPRIVSLADVGGVIPGAVFDGAVIGDTLGFSLGGAHHPLKGSSPIADDLLIGAPGAEGARGKVYLIESRQFLSGPRSISDAGTCNLRGWEFVGDLPGQLVGTAVSRAGDVNGDGLPDVAIGGAGSLATGGPIGRAYLIFSSEITLPTAPSRPVNGPLRPFTP